MISIFTKKRPRKIHKAMIIYQKDKKWTQEIKKSTLTLRL